MTQKERAYSLLLDRKWHHHIAIMEYVCPGAVCMAVAQIIHKLRTEGNDIETRLVTGSGGSTMAEYRLVRTVAEITNGFLGI
jgi:hypothetical protein